MHTACPLRTVDRPEQTQGGPQFNIVRKTTALKMATDTIHVLDDYYLGITLLITILFQLSFFFIAFTFNTDKFTGKNLLKVP